MSRPSSLDPAVAGDGGKVWLERLTVSASAARSHDEHEHVERYRWAARRVSGEVLDIACGTGYGSSILAASGGARVTGADRDDEALRLAALAAPEATLARVSLPDLPFADASFDSVVSFETIEHVDADAATIASLRRVLRPGGTLILSTPNADARLSGEPMNPWHVREYSLDALIELVRSGGFEQIAVFGQRVRPDGSRLLVRQMQRVIAHAPVLCRPGRWWDTLAHGSPRVEPRSGDEQPLYWVVECR